LTYGVSRAPALLDRTWGSPRELAAQGTSPVTPLPTMAGVPSEPPQESAPLELAPTWKDAPRAAGPALAMRTNADDAKVELTIAESAPPQREEHAGRPDRRAERSVRREMPSLNAQEERGAPSTWPIVPPPTPAMPERDRVAMRWTLDDLFGVPGEGDTERHGSRREPAEHGAPSPPAASRAALVAAGSRISTCESVLASATDEIDMTQGRGAPDVSRDTYAAILEKGSYLSACSVAGGTVVEICAAVQHGRTVGVTVVSRPSDARMNACVRGAVASLAFPANARLDVTRTRFDAVRNPRGP
ncbi:MAG TPA: hypothetical protein VF395_14615, partial [Polyangiaceae bacterium]